MWVEFFKIIAWGIWATVSLFIVLGLLGQFYKPRMAHNAGKAHLVVVSVASNSVRNALLRNIRHHKDMGIRPYVLIDEGADLEGELRKMEGIGLVVVPKDYRRDLKGKGRAINYFIESTVHPGEWYGFIDDDNLLMDLKFLHEIPYYEKRGYVAANPVLKPRLGKSKTAFVMDWIRYLDDIMIFRFFTGLLKKPLIGLHGELLLVKGEVLKEIGFGEPSITEDFLFASKLVGKGYKTWQSSTTVSILSPNSTADLMKQRGRWFKGVFMDIFKPSVPPSVKAISGGKLILWMFGFMGSWLFFPLWVVWGRFWFAIPGAMAYWLTYLYGVKQLGEWRYALLIPAMSVTETLSWLKGVKMRKFVVIDKN